MDVAFLALDRGVAIVADDRQLTPVHRSRGGQGADALSEHMATR
jgi:hypothetical protein